MKNTHIGKSFYVISFFIALILLGAHIYLNQSDSGENTNVSEVYVEVEKNTLKKAEQTSDNPKISEDQNNLPDTDEIEESQPKEIRIVAEEILYPDEYDFGDSMSSVFIAAGKPIKIDTLPLTKLQQGDTFQLEFNNISIEAIIDEVSLRYYTREQTDENQGNLTVKRFSGILSFDTTRAHNFINGSVIYGENGVVDSRLWIDSKYGEYQFDIYKNVGYYVEEGARQKEVYDRGIRID